MIEIRLPRGEWKYDPNARLGQAGGFGAVFEGFGENYGAVAIKKLHIRASDAAHRELQIADVLVTRQLKHVVPILDAGMDSESDSYFVVMSRAEKSLQQEIDRLGKFSEAEALHILRDIAMGLSEVSDITHRDLKPGNVLYHEEYWKIADFGIARFVENATSLRTLKGALTPLYAAPEQWRLERSTSATDIYALGCVAYALLTGLPPFQGPSRIDYQEQHLHQAPEPLTNVGPHLRSLVASMLRKPQQSRPGVDRIISVLNNLIQSNDNEGERSSPLAQAGAVDAEAAIQADARRNEERTRYQVRQQLVYSAFNILDEILNDLANRILEDAPTAQRINRGSYRLRIEFGTASLEVTSDMTHPIAEDAFKNSGWDVIASAIITVIQNNPTLYKWSANLWYTNLGQEEGYRWWEVLYFAPLARKPSPYEPFAVENLEDADLAASHVMHIVSLAAKPRPIDDEDSEDFYNRWMSLLATAYNGHLQHPSSLPLD